MSESGLKVPDGGQLPRAVGPALVGVYVLYTVANMGGTLSGDDHYSLWAAAALQQGDRPNIDFFDPGSPLQWWLSYLGQLATGGRTIGEVLLATLLKTLGVVAVFRMSVQLVGRNWYALASPALVAFAYGAYNVYSAEKAFVYPVAMLAGWAYLRGRLHPSMLGAVLAVAFLFRHDHGVYVGCLVAVAILMGPRPVVAALGGAGLSALAICAPWLVWLASTEGLVQYFVTRIALAAGAGLAETRPFLSLDGPLWSIDAALRLLWHIALVVPFLGLWGGLRAADRRVALLSLALLPVTAGLMRRAMHVTETAVLWVPLAAWIAVQKWSGLAGYAVRFVASVSIALLLVITGTPQRLWRLTVTDGGLLGRAQRSIRFHSLPRALDNYAGPEERSERLVVRYVAQCLDEDDRIWDTSAWWPMSYYTRRLPAWHTQWEVGFLSDDTSQRRFLTWVERQSAPVILVRRRDADEVFGRYRLVRQYVSEHYERATSDAFEQFVAALGSPFQILVRTDRAPTGRFTPLDLPCFATSPQG
jgi:hypothetical protein